MARMALSTNGTVSPMDRITNYLDKRVDIDLKRAQAAMKNAKEHLCEERVRETRKDTCQKST